MDTSQVPVKLVRVCMSDETMEILRPYMENRAEDISNFLFNAIDFSLQCKGMPILPSALCEGITWGRRFFLGSNGQQIAREVVDLKFQGRALALVNGLAGPIDISEDHSWLNQAVIEYGRFMCVEPSHEQTVRYGQLLPN